jgi:hypothetical protein
MYLVRFSEVKLTLLSDRMFLYTDAPITSCKRFRLNQTHDN